MECDLRRIKAAEARHRRVTFPTQIGTLTGRIEQSQLERDVPGDVYTELIAIHPGEYLTLQSAFHFRVLRGAVEFNGHVYTPRQRTYTKVLVPSWHPPERMVSLCDGNHTAGFTAERSASTSCHECRRIVTQNFFGGSSCAIRARVAEDTALMEKHFNMTKAEVKRSPESDDPDSDAIKFYDAKHPFFSTGTLVSFITHTCAFGTTNIRNVLVPPIRTKITLPQLIQAARALLKLCTKGDRLPVLMVHGDKGAGKSTSIMYIVNYLLNHVNTVALLDTDVGQPIFSPPGTISLKFVDQPINAPPHALLAEYRPDVTYLIGDVKVINPSMMLRHTHRCFEIYTSAVGDDRSVPLVVNTFGWISGMGAKLLESIAAITKTGVMLKLNSKHLKGVTLPPITTHHELENVLRENLTIAQESTEPGFGLQTEAFPIHRIVVEQCGAKLPWDTDSCTIIETLCHSQARKLAEEGAQSLKANCSDEPSCLLHLWAQFSRIGGPESEVAGPNDLRWLRACSILNSSFGDAMHFPQLLHEEFFGSIKTTTFRRYVRRPHLFKTPNQLLLMAERYSFVVRIHTPLQGIEELCPFIAGTFVALCRGHCEHPMSTEIAEDWEFIAYVYVHYLNADDMTMLISHSQRETREQLLAANLVVVCPTVGLDTIPTRLCPKPKYECTEASADRTDAFWKPRELSTSQFVPFRRNHLLHMINAHGAGNAAGNSRKNIKRHKQDVKSE
ncbi:Polynucleotide 5'-hydroxyl-kinase NOL9 [Babesia sp. Xinjiang]|uniref:Polynucleotide 5'-hydroxyl-kinase NOL9 n=1 Tax=Babesia sp. Xinjiang TaxID=462227 RepID=UPI000A2280CB|nr:Polynucleotide 5'-hydroxyl-kinase NOL9 [Babesia sp. Xinjiang]ORM41533.1 Polynucleotide 5'-hydroxyl-kinase NOL9 [Babesia sp. Xinjiang]